MSTNLWIALGVFSLVSALVGTLVVVVKKWGKSEATEEVSEATVEEVLSILRDSTDAKLEVDDLSRTALIEFLRKHNQFKGSE